jgi:hypothetical protein
MSSELWARAWAPICALLLGAAPALAAEKAPRTDPMTLKATGEPRTCIPNRANISTKQSGDSVLMFRSGSIWFRNELRARCPMMRDDRVLIFRTTTTQYCELDPFEIVDPVSGINFGICSLGQFTPVEVPKGTRFSK